VDHIFAASGVTEPFAGQAFDRRGILQGAQAGIQFPGPFRFHVNFPLQFQLGAAQALIILDDRLVPKENSHQAGDDQQGQHQTK